jgi:hypothetical protein
MLKPMLPSESSTDNPDLDLFELDPRAFECSPQLANGALFRPGPA